MRHDAAYKRLFSHAELVADLLRACLEDGLSRTLDYASLERVDASSVDEKLHQRHADVIWKLRLGEEGWLYVYLLLEFQSKPDRSMPFRMLQYVVGCYDQLRRSGALPERDLLPPVLPVVLYRGNDRWKGPLMLSGLRPRLSPLLEAFQPQLTALLIDEAEHLGDPGSPVRNLAQAIFRIEHAESAEAVEQVLADLQVLLQSVDRHAVRQSVLIWLTRAYLPTRMPDVEWERIVELAEVPEMVSRRHLTWVEIWKRDAVEEGLQEGRQVGLQEGRQVGLQEGRQVGLQEAHQRALERQTHKRFGAEAARHAAAQLRAIGDPVRLEQLAEDFLDCATPEQWLALLTPDADAA